MNGYLMHKDSVVSRIENDIILNDNHRLPLMLKKGSDITPWICSRAVDRHRTNSRLLKKVIRLSDTSDVSTVLKAHAATVTDNYWIKFDSENIEYKDILLNDDSLADVALFGTFESISNAKYIHCEYSKSPELTNIGSFEKCWRLKNNKWYMYKKESPQERFSEIFIYKLGTFFGYDMAQYEQDGDCVVTEDFTLSKKYDFESAASIVGDDEDYTLNYKKLYEISPNIAYDYLKIVFMDTLCMNMDRHTNNYGILRNSENGAIEKSAPNFDNNIALISRGYTSTQVSQNDLLITLWREFCENIDVDFQYPTLKKDDIARIAYSIEINVDKQYVVDFVYNRYLALTK